MKKGFVNDQNTGRPDDTYRNVIKDIAQDGVCPFCPEHLATYHKNPAIIDGKYWILTDSMYPYKNSAHHFLIIHKAHVEHIHQVSSLAWKELKTIIDNAQKDRKMPGATLLFRFGDTRYTGASVSHLHAQLVSGTGKKDVEPIITRVG